MIARLTGRLAECSPNRALLDVAGVGYEVHIPLSTFYVLSASPGREVSLHVHTHVREDALQLFGFATPDERRTFEQLLAISGVGPRMALAILSGIGVDELRQAVAGQDRERLQRIPGVGKKTAERVLLELRDRLGGEPATPGAAIRSGAAPPSASSLVLEDGVSALVNLGYARDVARRAVEGAIRSEGPDVALEVVLKRALGGLVH